MLLDDVSATLHAINLEPVAIQSILDMLEESATEVQGGIFDNVPAGRFGGSDAGATLAADTMAARQKVREAMEDMVAGLRGYSHNISAYVDRPVPPRRRLRGGAQVDAERPGRVDHLRRGTEGQHAEHLRARRRRHPGGLVTGPEQEKLRRGVDGASSGDLLAASDKWGTASLLLRQVADQLAVHASAPREVIGGLTGSATSEAFVRSSKAMGDKSDELNNGSNALLSAGRALSQAESEHSSLGPQPALEGRPPTTPGPSTPETVREQSAYDTYAAGWHADFERREARARQANEQMEAAFRDSSAEMREDPWPAGEAPDRRGRLASRGHRAVRRGRWRRRCGDQRRLGSRRRSRWRSHGPRDRRRRRPDRVGARPQHHHPDHPDRRHDRSRHHDDDRRHLRHARRRHHRRIRTGWQRHPPRHPDHRRRHDLRGLGADLLGRRDGDRSGWRRRGRRRRPDGRRRGGDPASVVAWTAAPTASGGSGRALGATSARGGTPTLGRLQHHRRRNRWHPDSRQPRLGHPVRLGRPGRPLRP